MSVANFTSQDINTFILAPLQKTSLFFSTAGTTQDGQLLGVAPIGFDYDLGKDSYLTTLQMPIDGFRTTGTDAEIEAGTFAPKHKFSTTSQKWEFEKYAVYTTVTRKQVEDAKIQLKTLNFLGSSGDDLADVYFMFFREIVKNSILRYSFWSQTGVNFRTTYPNALFDTSAGSTMDVLPLKNGFVKIIKDAVARVSNPVPNYDTTSLNGSALTTAECVALLQDVLDNADTRLSDQITDEGKPIEERPVLIVSNSVYRAYLRVMQDKGDYASMLFTGYDMNGNPLRQVRLPIFENVMVLNGSAIFDDWERNTKMAGTPKHYAILTMRSNLRIGYNVTETELGNFTVSQMPANFKFALALTGEPQMDFKIALDTPSAMSVAGFQA